MDNYYDNNNFDLEKFNKRFKEIQNKEKEEEKLEREEYIKSLEKKEENKKITDLSVAEILENTKDEVLDLTYEIISFEYEGFDGFINLFKKNNRLFYVGLFMLIMCCILYLISYIFFYPSDIKRNDININIPNDYSFNYKPYEVQRNEQSEEIIKLKEQIELLKNPPQAPVAPQAPVPNAQVNQNNVNNL
jgi:hypothetical protein